MGSKACPRCGEKMIVTEEDYAYTGCGLENVVLRGVTVRTCAKDGERIVAIPAIEGLHRVIMEIVVAKPTRLAPSEVRFLRKFLGWSGVELAHRMSVAPATVSRWEHGEQPIGVQSDKVLRHLAMTSGKSTEYPDLTREESATGTPMAIRLTRAGDRWEHAIA